MDERRALAHLVLNQGASLAQACRLAGVTRKTGRKWVRRARQAGIESLAELSRRPETCPHKTSDGIERELVELKMRFPCWGAKKLTLLLEREQGLHLPLRTADRILERRGLVQKREAPEPLQRFERERPLDLLQNDFKGMPLSAPYSVLTLLDDSQRFCLAFEPLKDRTGSTVFSFLWEVFGEHGLPLEMLMDNGDCWGAWGSLGPTRFEARLMLLGIHPIHGRPRHPQTQGKVERFHGTAKRELGNDLVQPTLEQARAVYQEFRDRYNWVRPHEALGGQVPGQGYAKSPRKRPEKMPEHRIPEGAQTRKVCAEGRISFKGRSLKLGKGLTGEHVVVEQAETGLNISFAGFPLRYSYER